MTPDGSVAPEGRRQRVLGAVAAPLPLPRSAPPLRTRLATVADPRRLLRYLATGACAAATHIGVLTALVEVVRVQPVLASTAGFLAGLVVSYTVQRRWVFASRGRHRSLLPRFLTVTAVALGLNTVVLHVGTEVLTVHYVLVQLVAFGLIPISNYLLNSLWTFR